MIRINTSPILSCVILLLIFSCNSSTESNSKSETNSTPDSVIVSSTDESKVSFKIFMNDSTDKSKGYGYDIFVGVQRYIHQQNIPAVNGNQIFKTEADAQAVAQLMSYKIQNKIMPPTVTVRELDSLGVTVNKIQ